MSSTSPIPDPIVRVGKEAGTPAGSTRASVAIGFGSPAGDSGVTRLDLNDILIAHPQATFLMRAAGHDMQAMGIDAGDLLLVDRAVAPVHGHVVIAVVDDEFVCRKLGRQGAGVRLQASRAGCPDIVASEGTTVQLWGVVTQVIKPMPV
jgi:DNA polymerase V